MKTILAVSAHPDDIEFGCSGTIYKFIKKGYKAILVVVTNGESGFKQEHKPKFQRVNIREKEQKKAASILGIEEVIFLHEKDGFLKNTPKLRKKLVSIIKKYKPSIIFTFDPGNKDFSSLNLHHTDHREVGEAVFDAAFAAKNKYLFPGKPHKIDSIYFFGSNKVNHKENITKFMDVKMKALAQHKSQFPDFNKIKNYVKKFLYDKKSKSYLESFRVLEVVQLT